MDTVRAAPIQNDVEAKKSSRLWALTFSALSVITVVLCGWTFSGLKSNGSIYSVETTYNFGAVHEGDLLHHTFTVRNLHPWPITVTNVGATCGCTTAAVRRNSPIRLLPLQSTVIDVTLDTAGDRGTIQEGVIVAAGGGNYYNLLYVKATVKPRIKGRKGGA